MVTLRQTITAKNVFIAKTGAIEIFLKHVWEDSKEAIIVDMSAGKDVFASPLPCLFDANLYIVRPTRKSVANAKDFLDHAKNFGVEMWVVTTDIRSNQEVKAIENELARPVDAVIPNDQFFVQRDSLLFSRPPHIREASFAVLDAFYNLTDLLKQIPDRDWGQLFTQMIYHHEETANDWAGDKFNAQIEPGVNPFLKWSVKS
ncbi:MAG: hypothetical protein HC908_12855 [Calothrix sp. SM1_7_51]|nr:hypothetical protein [Calothrix sp. SM1_7_51]